MTDAEKLALCKAIINDAFAYGCDSAESNAATMNAVVVVMEFKGGDKDGCC